MLCATEDDGDDDDDDDDDDRDCTGWEGHKWDKLVEVTGPCACWLGSVLVGDCYLLSWLASRPT